MIAGAELEGDGSERDGISTFEEIMILHEHQVLMTALRLLGNIEDAQDAAQEVFLRLYKYRRRFDAAREIAPWLYRITVNVCRDISRSRRKRSSVSLEDAAPEIAGANRDPRAEIAESEQRRIVAEALQTLPEKERVAVVLRDIEGLSTREVARILGSSETTVRSQISTARVKLKKFADRILRRPEQ